MLYPRAAEQLIEPAASIVWLPCRLLAAECEGCLRGAGKLGVRSVRASCRKTKRQ